MQRNEIVKTFTDQGWQRTGVLGAFEIYRNARDDAFAIPTMDDIPQPLAEAMLKRAQA